MPGSRLQVSHSVPFPMKRLVASTDPALPQLHVDLLDTLCLLAFSLADSPWARITPYARYAGGWAGGSGALSLCAPLPFRVGLVRALDHRLVSGVPGGSASSNLRLPYEVKPYHYLFLRLRRVINGDLRSTSSSCARCLETTCQCSAFACSAH